MGLLSIGIGNDAIRFSREGVILGMVPLHQVSAEGLAVFKRTNYDLQGSAGYQQFLEGALCGLTLAYGPPIPTSVEISASEAEQLLNPDVMTEPAKELQSIDASEVGAVEDVLLDPRPLPGEEIIVPGYTVHDGVVVGTVKETAAVPVAVEDVLLDPRPLPGEEIIVPGYTVHDGVVVGTVKETAAVPVAGEAVVGTIVHEEHGGLTPSRSPDAAQ